jgi:hypothetical protein
MASGLLRLCSMRNSDPAREPTLPFDNGDRDPGREPDGDALDDDDDDDDDAEQGVARNPAAAPGREEEESELADEDILERLDLDDLEDMEGPDA